MNTYGLLEELSKKPKEEIRLCLLALMLNKKIDFLDVNQSYIELLQKENNKPKSTDNKEKVNARTELYIFLTT